MFTMLNLENNITRSNHSRRPMYTEMYIISNNYDSAEFLNCIRTLAS